MHLQPLSLLPDFHPTSPGDHDYTSWWTAGPEATWPLGSFHHENNRVQPSALRPAGTELTQPLSQDWPIVQHPTIPRCWGVFDRFANPGAVMERVHRWTQSCCCTTPLTLDPEVIDESSPATSFDRTSPEALGIPHRRPREANLRDKPGQQAAALTTAPRPP